MKTKISKLQWLDVADMWNNIYRVSIRTNYENRYWSFSINIAANDPKEAKAFINGLIEKNIGLIPEDANDSKGYDKFVDAVIAGINADKKQQQYFNIPKIEEPVDKEPVAPVEEEPKVIETPGMKENFNAWTSKFIDNENISQVISDLQTCYYKYNGYKEAENFEEIIDALNYENAKKLADRWGMELPVEDNEYLQDLWARLSIQELIAGTAK